LIPQAVGGKLALLTSKTHQRDNVRLNPNTERAVAGVVEI
jgi:hypothetical protein